MTILIDPTLAAALLSAGTENNPIVAYVNEADNGTLSTSIGTSLQAAAFAGTGTTYDRWVATGAAGGNASLQLALGAPASLSFCAITAHNIGTLGASVRVEYSVNGGSSWIDCGAGTAAPDDNQAIGFYFDAVSAQHWRVLVVNAAGQDVEIGVALFSRAIVIEQRIYQGYAPPITQNVVELQSNVSEGGNFLGSSEVRKGSMASAELSEITPAFLRSAEWKGFQAHFNEGGGMFWAWRPTDYGDLFYAIRQGAVIAPSNTGPKDYMGFTMNMRLYDDP